MQEKHNNIRGKKVSGDTGSSRHKKRERGAYGSRGRKRRGREESRGRSKRRYESRGKEGGREGRDRGEEEESRERRIRGREERAEGGGKEGGGEEKRGWRSRGRGEPFALSATDAWC